MKTSQKQKERKKQILDISENLFAKKGYDYTSTNDILKEADIARGTLYYYFKSKEEILDSVINQIIKQVVTNASLIANNKSIPVLERLTKTIMALNIETDIGYEVMKQIHKPQNALMHQKMQKSLLANVNIIITTLIEECIDEKICQTDYPNEVVEMIMLYSNTVFDDLIKYSDDEKEQKILGFIYNVERMLGMKQDSLKTTILPIFKK